MEVKGKIGTAVSYYHAAKKRSTKMKRHWAVARLVQKETGQSIGNSRRITTALTQGAEFAGRGAKRNYRYNYLVQLYDTDGSERASFHVSITSDVPLGVREQKLRVVDFLKEQADKKQYQGIDYTKRKLYPEEFYVRGKDFNKVEEVKYEKTDKSRGYRALRGRAERKHAGFIKRIDEAIRAEERRPT